VRNIVEPDAKTGTVLAREPIGCNFEQVELSFSLDLYVVRAGDGNPFAISKHLDDEVHLYPTREVQSLQLNLVLQISAIVLAAGYF
jgi:hypothetical protein